MSPIKICVTGAAGQIAYSLLYNIARGDIYGPSQEVILHLLDIEPALTALQGVVMELEDCSLPLLKGCICTASPEEAFTDVDAAILVGAMPRREGMLRADLLKANANIFKVQGAAMDKMAKKTIKVLVVGNPANTNAMIVATAAPSIPKENFTCLTRLDMNRALSQVAMKLNVAPQHVTNVIIWGNHSSTQYPDLSYAMVNGALATELLKDDTWVKEDFIKTVQNRGAAVIGARKLSSAMSAAKAIVDHMRDWIQGTQADTYVSMGVFSDGTHYDIPEGIVYSMPVTIRNGEYKIVEGLAISEFSKEKMTISTKELVAEKDTALSFFK